jgi:ATP-binding cassette subfamily F protein uup
MALLNLQDVSFTYRKPALLEDIDLEINAGERIGLLGRNGMGKSTLMKIMAGELEPDHGRVVRGSNVQIARLEQEVPEGESDKVSAIVALGLAPGEQDLGKFVASKQAVDKVLSRMNLDPEEVFGTLSSGMKRRVLLAQALVREPDLLLLDEPTNHLDIESIDWLERFLKGYTGALVFVTHDRVFLRALATRILEVDRGRIFDWTCDYETFLKRKELALHTEALEQASFDRKLAQEEAWIRQGIKARRTRNEGRVKALKAMRTERGQRRDRLGNVRMRAMSAEQSGQLVIEVEDLQYAYDEQPIIDGFSTLITRGEKIGIIGPNGAGKTTLLKLLLGDLKPNEGTVRHGTRLQVIYFDQLREQIDGEMTVAENVGEGQDMLEFNGKKKHIYGYLQEFLFTPERARQQAKLLSGGERNRLLLARLFKRPSNVMVLDEPTNDLDAETLDLLEELVDSYDGTLLLVSHDRAFLNNVVTSVIAIDGVGGVRQYDGGYDDYARQVAKAQAEQAKLVEADGKKKQKKGKKSSGMSGGKPKVAKLSFNEKRELDELPAKVEQLEAEQAEMHATMAEPDFFKSGGDKITQFNDRLEQLQSELQVAYARWEELESRA